ncbi:thioredoxin-related transmembrane protein 1 [Aplysia californica]|uniref:Thioredoxin-related transmembrane protein 1 n=1 Tax=Aplysia californica TaxID=6500 RepID=A0ABM0K0K7_APLCA|nr:thioredoxin-related transmembrane protein 1 [Aplysia californica]
MAFRLRVKSLDLDLKDLTPLIFILSCVISGVISVQDHKNKEPITVTDANWTRTLEGEWMLEFMAPWCPACRAFQDVWAEFAGWGYDLDISVGVVDVTENPGLSGRFLVTSLPTLYHVKDGVFRHYYGGRKTTDLISLIDEKKWRDITPVAWYRDPNSFLMGIVGAFFKAAMFIRGVYNRMTEVYGIPEWACYLIFAILTIITGLLLGLLLVVCCDNFFPAKYIPLPPERIAHKPKDVPKDDTDIVDDTEEAAGDGDAGKEEDDKAASSQEDNAPKEDSELRKRLPHTEEK